MKNIVVIDGQGGRIGKLIVEGIKASGLQCHVTGIGTNGIATSAMLKAGADAGATGENPVVVACRTADIIVGPIGMLVCDALLGEVTSKMATAIGRSDAVKLLMPVNQCNNIVVGTMSLSIGTLVSEAVEQIRRLCAQG
ncbi:MAG: DUF3842 family protein [Clostridia bacterium]|nr:DUF3842 family protein [Clostridia bacterium]